MTHYSQEMAEYRGEVYFAGAEGDDHVWIRKVPGTVYANQEAFETYNGRELKTVAKEELDAWYRDEMTAKWRGQPFVVHPNRDGTMGADYVGPSQVWAEDNGLEGDPYNGFHKVLDPDELEDVQVDRTDYLARWKEKNQG